MKFQTCQYESEKREGSDRFHSEKAGHQQLPVSIIRLPEVFHLSLGQGQNGWTTGLHRHLRLA